MDSDLHFKMAVVGLGVFSAALAIWLTFQF
jgi:hypothetical protein